MDLFRYFCLKALHLISEIHTQQLIKAYGRRTVVNNVSVGVKQGEIVGLLGPNGAGKTTTFYMVVGLIKPDDGQVFLDKEEITKMPMYKRAQLGIGYLPQEASVFRSMSVEDNIKAILEMTRLRRSEQKEKLESLLDEFRLHHVRKNKGDSLSGGERRRTEIARALAVDPKFILLDEPFAGVDPIAVEDIQSVVARLKYKNIGILITDHNVNETLSICDRAYLLIEGKIFKHGTAEELAEDEQVRRLYLGRNFELKRKDYLHEEAMLGAGKEVKLNNLMRAMENCILETDKVMNDYINWSPSLQDTDPLTLGMSSDTSYSIRETKKVEDYCRFLEEIKRALYDYAITTNDEYLKERAIKISSISYKDFTPTLADNPEVSLGEIIGLSSLPDLKEKIIELKTDLEQTLAVLKNPAWKEVYK